MLDMHIQDLPPLRVAAVRHVGPFTGLGPSFERVCAWAGQHQLFEAQTSVLGIFHDDPKTTPEAELRSDAAVTVGASVQPDSAAGIEIREVPGGKYAVGVLTGPYEQLPAAYEWIHSTWLPTSGEAPTGDASYEVYLNDASTTPKAELKTAIHIPLA